ncbi:MAG TPA: ATP-binding protein [Chitinophagaceae bacterium]|nr:ATP-binding protein [Chitinophagaceae bacterium]
MQKQPLTVNNPMTDLSNCDKEPIHIPGKIQPHGFLLAVNKTTWLIDFTSANTKQFTGLEPGQLLGKSLADIVAAGVINCGNANLFDVVQYLVNTNAQEANPIAVQINAQACNLIVNFAEHHFLLEFEPSFPDIDKELQRLMGISLSKILEASTIEEILQFTAKQVKEIIHYDRIMVYKFWEDDHGEVVGEEREPHLESFMGLHYPASDIPKQARELYKINLVRIIADVTAVPSALFTTQAGLSTTSLNLTNSVLRAVSPIHIQYLQNMDVRSSFSISVIINDRLWGLIACHNYTPKFIDYKARNSCKLIARILSSALEHRLEIERKEKSKEFHGALQEILKLLMRDWNVAEVLMQQKVNLLSLTEACGAAFLFEGCIYVIGETPGDSEISALYNKIKKEHRSSIFHTTNLDKIFASAGAYKNVASGLLGCSISWEMDEYIMWFKPEIKKTVKWAGNPNKPVETDEQGNQQISPRRSFAVWSEEVEGTSEPWTSADIGSVMKLREELIHMLNSRANQVRKLNDELKKAYEELDTFSFTISHDLKTPLASIRNYSEILLEDHDELTDDVKKILNKVIKNTERMDVLIREVLSYSRIGKQDLHLKKLPVKLLVETAVQDALSAYGSHKTNVQIGNLPEVEGDEIMISQVFGNLIGNAVKYSAKNDTPLVKIEGKITADGILYTVQDNGIGIDMLHGNQVFDLFKRMDNAKAYEGTGVGLAIVKRILEKHKARIWYESGQGKGTTFFILFKAY